MRILKAADINGIEVHAANERCNPGLGIGIVTGLARLGIDMPAVASERVALHGPILIAGVFGTLISLERAVAMKTLLGEDELRSLGVDPGLRPESLAIADYVALANYLSRRGGDSG